jgi:hypothetical protein
MIIMLTTVLPVTACDRTDPNIEPRNITFGFGGFVDTDNRLKIQPETKSQSQGS